MKEGIAVLKKKLLNGKVLALLLAFTPVLIDNRICLWGVGEPQLPTQHKK